MSLSRRSALRMVAGSAAASFALTAGTPLVRVARARSVDVRSLVYAVKSVELIMLKSQPPQYRLRIVALVPNAEWSEPDLVPVATDLPPGSIWEFRLIAQPGVGGKAWTGAELDTVYSFPNRMREGIDLRPRGVRIRVATGLFSRGFGGQPIDLPEPNAANCPRPSADWIGKRLVRAGEIGDGVKESELCRPYTVITPDRPIIDLMYSPARLRLELDAAGIIRGMSAG